MSRVAGVVASLMLVCTPALARNADGTLGLLRYPVSTQPVLALTGSTFEIRADAPANATGFKATLTIPEPGFPSQPLVIEEAAYDPVRKRWTLLARLPFDAPADLYDLELTYAGGADTSKNAVRLFDEWPTEYRVAHISDTQELFAIPGVTPKTAPVLRDLQVIGPAFVLHTGDIVNYGTESEYRTYLGYLESVRLPVFHIPGNHDVFWLSCADRDKYQARYERFIGEREFHFDFGKHRYVGIELSGYKEFCAETSNLTAAQQAWLEDALSTHALGGGTLRIVFGHQGEHSASALNTLLAKWSAGMYLFGHVHADKVLKEQGITHAAVGWAGDGAYRLIDIANDQIGRFTFQDDPVASIRGGDAVKRSIHANGGDPFDVTILLQSEIDDLLTRIPARVTLPPRGERLWQVEGATLRDVVDGTDASFAYVEGIDVPAKGSAEVRLLAVMPPTPTEPLPSGALPRPQTPGDDADAESVQAGCSVVTGATFPWWLLLVTTAWRARRPRRGPRCLPAAQESPRRALLEP